MRAFTSKLIPSLTALTLACTPRRSALPPVMPPPPSAVDTSAITNVAELRLIPGRIEYRLTQTSKVHTVATPDTAPGTFLLTARLLLDVASTNDSTYEIAASIDSLQTVTGGSIPSRADARGLSLGPVLRASVGPGGSSVVSSLADSLCAYGQLVTLVRDVVLPQLPAPVRLPIPGPKTDTARITACRAGTRVEMLVTRRISSLGTELSRINYEGTTELSGTGTLGRNSVVVSGSITTRGTASVSGKARLPTILEGESDGLITVRLGDSTTVFRQTSSHRLEQHRPLQPSQVPPD